MCFIKIMQISQTKHIKMSKKKKFFFSFHEWITKDFTKILKKNYIIWAYLDRKKKSCLTISLFIYCCCCYHMLILNFVINSIFQLYILSFLDWFIYCNLFQAKYGQVLLSALLLFPCLCCKFSSYSDWKKK